MRMRADERWIISPNLPARELGVMEKMQIVNRDDLCRMPGRHDERMQRMGDVERAARYGFDGRPAKTMPGEIEDGHRNASIDRFDRTEINRRMQAVLPGARKDGDFRRPLAGRSRNVPGKRGHHLVTVLANAASPPERGAIVDEHSHLCKSFRVSILL